MIKGLKIDNNKGVAAVEFALILIPLILLLFGTIEVGLLVYNKQIITGASREGARAGIVASLDREAQPEGEHITTSRNVATTYCSDKLITFGDSVDPLKVEATYDDDNDNEDGIINFGDDLTVTVSYDYGFLVLGNLGFVPEVNLVSTTVMKLE